MAEGTESGNRPEDESPEAISVVVKFKVEGDARYLSHAETLRVFQRACARAKIAVQYNRGFNPRPRLSLPLPRSVGVVSDDERLCIRVSGESDLVPGGQRAVEYESRARAAMSEQLPMGLELLSAKLVRTGTRLQPSTARYVLLVRRGPEARDCLSDILMARAKLLLDSKSLFITRKSEPAERGKRGVAKKKDVRPFLRSIELNERQVDARCGEEHPVVEILVECKISPAGSIRVDEILQLLELDQEKLALPVRRTNVQWEEHES
ncbi:MAG: DUF2344 domain-containing protein [Phycisphaerales bacterium]|nr:MAG: DUF2344 domain-containing protein [Phycisphaerales bacterium]